MKRIIFALVSMLVLFLAAPVCRAQPVCSNATLYNIGTYSWVEQVSYPTAGAWVGYVSFLSSGSWLGVITGGTGGSLSSNNISGTYSVNSNCTLAVNFANGGVHTQGIIVSSGNEVFLDQATPGATYLVDLKGVGATSCSNATLYNIGNYGWASESFYPAIGIDVGYISFTSSGTLAGVIYGGTTGSGSSYNIAGTYAVISNCTLSVNFSGGSTAEGIIVSNGKEVILTQSSPSGTNEIMDLKTE